jgi:quercetin dioxygenase-like cupin family protein
MTGCRRSRSKPSPGNRSTEQSELAVVTADTVYGGHEKVLRQTVIGMKQGARLAEHENPGEATVQVLHGRVRMIAGDLSWEARTGDLLIVPDARHSLEALEDSALLLTVANCPDRKFSTLCSEP